VSNDDALLSDNFFNRKRSHSKLQMDTFSIVFFACRCVLTQVVIMLPTDNNINIKMKPLLSVYFYH
jgi:hypothetical protein